MEQIRVIGLWLGEHDPDWPSVSGFVSSHADPSHREAVAARLDVGRPTDRAYMGYSVCRICGCRNGSGERTNGVFIWPEGLGHYVREHQVVLPEEVEGVLLDASPLDESAVDAAASAANEQRDVEWWRSIASPG